MSITARFRIDRQSFCLEVDQRFPGRGVSAIFGPSGSGKTTFLRAIAGLERSPEGYLEVGRAIWQDEDRFVPPHQRAVGYVFQEPSLFSHLTVRRNIEYGRRRIPPASRKVSADDAIELLGIGHLLHRRPHELSGGEQQRVSIARALATSPAVLLMDEPLASLDAALKREIMPYLESLHRELDIPMLYVSHSTEEVMRMADHVVLLRDGRVREAGPADSLFTRLDPSVSSDQEPRSMIRGVVAGHDDAFGLAHVDFNGGRLILAHDELPNGRAVRLLVKATDISLVLERPAATSIQNILPATVTRLEPAGTSQVNVLLKVGEALLIARITRKASVTLRIKPDARVFIQIKSVAVMS